MIHYINTYPVDLNVEKLDYLLGSDKLTGKTYSYPIEKIIDLIGVNVGSVTGVQVETVNEDGIAHWIDIVNVSPVPITFFAGVVGYFDVYDLNGEFKETHALIKNQTSPLSFGLGYAPLTEDMLLPVRVVADNSRPTIAEQAILSTGIHLFESNDPDNYKILFKGLKEGYNIGLTEHDNDITIAYTGDVGEINNIIDAENAAGNVTLAAGKDGVDLKIKTLQVKGVPVKDHTDYVEIAIWQKATRSSSFTLTDSETHTTFWIDASASIDVTIPASLALGFEAAFVKVGAGNVRFVNIAGTTLLSVGNTIAQEAGTAWLENAPSEPKKFVLAGDLIVT